MIKKMIKKESIFAKISSQKYLVLPVLAVILLYGFAEKFTEQEFTIIDTILYLVIPGALVSFGVFAVLKIEQPTLGRAFTWLLAAFVFDFIAEQLWDIFDYVLGIDPFPSIADFFYMGAYVFLALFLFNIVFPLRKLVPKKVHLISAAISIALLIPSFLITFDWYSDSSTFERIVGLSYPILDSILLGMSLLALMFFFRKTNYFWICFTLGIILWVIADTVFISVELNDSYHVGHPVDSIWLIAYLVIAAGIHHRIKHSGLYAKQYHNLMTKDKSKQKKLSISSTRDFIILLSIVTFVVISLLYVFEARAYGTFSSKEISAIEIIIYGSIGVTVFFMALLFGIQKSFEKTSTKLKRIKKTPEPDAEQIHRKKEIEISEYSQRISFLEKSSQKTYNMVLIISITLGIILLYVISASLMYPISESLSSGPFLIENLHGDVIHTWVSWKIFEGESISVNIINSAQIPHEKIEKIKSVILSDEILQVSNADTGRLPADSYSTYYLGWKGALQKAAEMNTAFVIPTLFDVTESDLSIADINIIISNAQGNNGELGFTKAIADEQENQILKVFITINEAENRSGDELAAIVRHEMGHALGIIHATSSDDLMYEDFKTDVPYISECDVDAITLLYNNTGTNQIVCRQ